VNDQERNILSNQKLVLDYLVSCSKLSSLGVGGQVHVTLKEGVRYKQWNITQLCKTDSVLTTALRYHSTIPFNPALYPLYHHRRTNGFNPNTFLPNNLAANIDIATGANTHIFVKLAQFTPDSERERGSAPSTSIPIEEIGDTRLIANKVRWEQPRKRKRK